LRQEGHREAGVLREVVGGMHNNIEVSTASWSDDNTKVSPQKDWYGPIGSNRALGWAWRWPDSDLEYGC
jgi:hypothetical protein